MGRLRGTATQTLAAAASPAAALPVTEHPISASAQPAWPNSTAAGNPTAMAITA
jgi:hypothetical protein